MKAITVISTFLGITIFMFGILKLVDPFKTWYTVQIVNSGTNAFLYWPGIAGEISVGTLFIGSVLLRKRLSRKVFTLNISVASVILIVLMVSAIRVHLHPNVPADILPLKIKPPFIPGLFFLLALTDLFLVRNISVSKNRYSFR